VKEQDDNELAEQDRLPSGLVEGLKLIGPLPHSGVVRTTRE